MVCPPTRKLRSASLKASAYGFAFEKGTRAVVTGACAEAASTPPLRGWCIPAPAQANRPDHNQNFGNRCVLVRLVLPAVRASTRCIRNSPGRHTIPDDKVCEIWDFEIRVQGRCSASALRGRIFMEGKKKVGKQHVDERRMQRVLSLQPALS